MNQEDIFTYARARVLQTPAYQGTTGFPEEVEKIRTLSQLVSWLGVTHFPPDHIGDAVATTELLTVLTTINHHYLPELLEYLLQTATNVMAPSEHSIQAVKDALQKGNAFEARRLAGRSLSWEVKRWRPLLREEVADWIVRHV